jgi:hypothetical protein
VQSMQSMQSKPSRPLRHSGVTVPLLADERSTVREENLGLMLHMTRFLGRCRCVGILLSIEQDRRTFGPKDRSKTGGIGFSRSKEKHKHWCNVGFLCIHLSPERNWIAQSRLQTVRQSDSGTFRPWSSALNLLGGFALLMLRREIIFCA